jgi:hypothetical protein
VPDEEIRQDKQSTGPSYPSGDHKENTPDSEAMNVFPESRTVTRGQGTSAPSRIDPDAPLCFDYKSRVPPVSGGFDGRDFDLATGSIFG